MVGYWSPGPYRLLVVSLVRMARPPIPMTLLGDTRCDAWTSMNGYVGSEGDAPNVYLELADGPMDDKFLRFKAARDIEPFECELTWRMGDPVQGTASHALMRSMGQSPGKRRGEAEQHLEGSPAKKPCSASPTAASAAAASAADASAAAALSASASSAAASAASKEETPKAAPAVADTAAAAEDATKLKQAVANQVRVESDAVGDFC